MTNIELNRLLVEHFGELQNEYDDEVSWQEGDETGSHVVYGDVLYPFFNKSIQTCEINAVKKVLNFLEEILLLQDSYASEVVTLSVLEPLNISENGKCILSQYSGSLVRNSLDAVGIRCFSDGKDVDILWGTRKKDR